MLLVRSNGSANEASLLIFYCICFRLREVHILAQVASRQLQKEALLRRGG